ncbi:ferredoxin [Streptomyces palmae]|uniref:Ferredoxin n=2 Tax=Streptomyces palmae TaxID=1701085 RepID=A0A4Z0GIU6_9ACTN|nr:ferredoxin [Streptomyces palmae]TGA95747.1 ferredoxin [Streptomyces palmae]
MKVTIDADRCVASGMCAYSAPEVFDQSEEDGVVVLVQDSPSADQHEAVRTAARNCPAQVITLDQ